MEAVKGVILSQGKSGGYHKTLVGLVILSDKPITDIPKKEYAVVMGSNQTQDITNALNSMPKYAVASEGSGDLDQMMLWVSNKKPTDFTTPQTCDET